MAPNAELDPGSAQNAYGVSPSTWEKVSRALNLQALRPTPQERAQLVEQVRRGAEDGVFQCVNFGVSDAVLTRIREIGTRFFSLPLEEKLNIRRSTEVGNSEGYIVKYTDPDSDEVFKSRREIFRIQAFPASRRTALDVWPDAFPEMRETMTEYMEGVKAFTLFLMGLLSEGLGLPASYMEENVGELHMLGVLCNYPKQDLPAGKCKIPGLLPHTDYNFMTFLQQDKQPGVQFWVDRQWVTMPIIQNALIVDLGELIEVMSNGLYPSPVHRVLSSATNDRLSVASAVDVAATHTIFPAPQLISADRPVRYRALPFGERIQQYAQAVVANDPDTTTKRAIFLDSSYIDRSKSLYTVDGQLFIDDQELVSIILA